MKYKRVSNAVLIDEIILLQNQIRDYYLQGEEREYSLELIRALEKAVLNTAEKSGNIAAVESFRQVTEAWWNWVEIFDNEYTRPFRNPSTDPEYLKFDNVRARCLCNPTEASAIIRLFKMSSRPELADILIKDQALSKSTMPSKHPDGNRRYFAWLWHWFGW